MIKSNEQAPLEWGICQYGIEKCFYGDTQKFQECLLEMWKCFERYPSEMNTHKFISAATIILSKPETFKKLEMKQEVFELIYQKAFACGVIHKIVHNRNTPTVTWAGVEILRPLSDMRSEHLRRMFNRKLDPNFDVYQKEVFLIWDHFVRNNCINPKVNGLGEAFLFALEIDCKPLSEAIMPHIMQISRQRGLKPISMLFHGGAARFKILSNKSEKDERIDILKIFTKEEITFNPQNITKILKKFKICNLIAEIKPMAIFEENEAGLTPVHYLFYAIAHNLNSQLIAIAKKWLILQKPQQEDQFNIVVANKLVSVKIPRSISQIKHHHPHSAWQDCVDQITTHLYNSNPIPQECLRSAWDHFATHPNCMNSSRYICATVIIFSDKETFAALNFPQETFDKIYLQALRNDIIANVARNPRTAKISCSDVLIPLPLAAMRSEYFRFKLRTQLGTELTTNYFLKDVMSAWNHFIQTNSFPGTADLSDLLFFAHEINSISFLKAIANELESICKEPGLSFISPKLPWKTEWERCFSGVQVNYEKSFSSSIGGWSFTTSKLAEAVGALDVEAVATLIETHPEDALTGSYSCYLGMMQCLCDKSDKRALQVLLICDLLADVTPFSIFKGNLKGLTPMHYLFRTIAKWIKEDRNIDDLIIIAKKWMDIAPQYKEPSNYVYQ